MIALRAAGTINAKGARAKVITFGAALAQVVMPDKDGKIGDVVQCVGIAERLGLRPDLKVLRPRPPWSWLAPRGPLDPREAPGALSSPLAPPYPDIAIASGRRAAPAMRALKRASGGRSFTCFLKDPRTGPGAADVIWVPEHDPLRGPNVVVTLTSPHGITPERLAAERGAPDPRLAVLPPPRTGLVLGGRSSHYRFEKADVERLVAIARLALADGAGLMVTPSRRTSPTLVAALAALADEPPFRARAFVWDGRGPNPYVALLALADALVVTGDSVNMLGEAAATGAPVHVVEPSGGHPKVTRFIDGLVARGAVRRWAGRLRGCHARHCPHRGGPLSGLHSRTGSFGNDNCSRARQSGVT